MGNSTRSFFGILCTKCRVSISERNKTHFETVKQGLYGKSVAVYAHTFLWDAHELSPRPSLEHLLTGFKSGSYQQSSQKCLWCVDATLEDTIKSADENIGFSFVRNVLKYSARDSYLVDIYDKKSANKANRQMKWNEEKRTFRKK